MNRIEVPHRVAPPKNFWERHPSFFLFGMAVAYIATLVVIPALWAWFHR